MKRFLRITLAFSVAYLLALACLFNGCVSGNSDNGTNSSTHTGTTASTGTLTATGSSTNTDVVNATGLSQKVMCGYQGWFGAPGDGVFDNWQHWTRNRLEPAPDTMTIDMWPDLSDFDQDELFPTAFQFQGGQNACLYSANLEKTVTRHFSWMKDYGIDGAFVQRFVWSLRNQRKKTFRDNVLSHCMEGASQHGRVFALMYDISGTDESELVSMITSDWRHLVDNMSITDSPRYLRFNGLPLVGIWGMGFTDRPGTIENCETIIEFFKNNPETKYRAALMGGVPTYWRTGTNDSKSGYSGVYASFDIISPWTVGRYKYDSEVDSFRTSLVEPDLTLTDSLGQDYMPVCFPGFSWANIMENAALLNQIPRRGGNLLWRQAYNWLDAGCDSLYVAMFDEVDEGTAIYKVLPTQDDLPSTGLFLPLNADGETLPSDWYLRLTGEAGKALRGEIPLTTQRPIDP